MTGITAGSGSNRNPEQGLNSTSPSLVNETPVPVRWQVLIVEDNRSDAYLIQRAIEGTNLSIDLHIVRDGEQAVQFFDQAGADPATPCPDIVILDINLPKKQGGDVLKYMRSRPNCAQAHVIVVSTSASERDQELMKELGADGYFHKPSEFDKFMKLGDLVESLLARDTN